MWKRKWIVKELVNYFTGGDAMKYVDEDGV